MVTIPSGPAQHPASNVDAEPVCPAPPEQPGRDGQRCAQSCNGETGSASADPVAWGAPAYVKSLHWRKFVLYLLLALTLSLLGGWLSYRYTVEARQNELGVAAERRLALYADNLERQIEKFGLLPLSASLNPSVREFLTKPIGPSQVEEMSNYLKTLNDSVGSSQTYLIDPSGRIVASSNWNQKNSFVGRDISYRPYFKQAAAGRTEGYYGVGTTSDAPGYFLSTAVEADGRRLGVVAIKIGLEQLERLWLVAEQPVLVSDANRVVILASVADWKYRVLGALGPDEGKRLDETEQYNHRRLRPLPWTVRMQYSATSALVRVGEKTEARDYLAVSRRLPQLSMQLTALSGSGDIFALAVARGTAVAVLIALAAALVHGLNQRRIDVRDRLAAREALQAAYGRLEILVEQRSAELRAANAELQHEVNERTQDAQRLINFQEELIRTENLAVIGQLSAGIAHEINQPLAALSTLAANAVRFLERDDLDTVRFNLERICQLVVRMGELTSQLRSFARRSSDDVELLDVAACIDNSVALLNHRMDKGGGKLTLFPPPEPLFARCGAIRLEQVLVNLISNAIDAVADSAAPKISIRWHQRNRRAHIEVTDNGVGLSEAVKARLFEPFFSTKTNSGLGLGLAISADIIKAFGGTLRGANSADGGAVFTIELVADQGNKEKTHE